jgi:hypothetical protein
VNVLALLHLGEITADQADEMWEEMIQAVNRGDAPGAWWDTFELTKQEATALSQGATFADLVKLRYQGWPIECCRCQLP